MQSSHLPVDVDDRNNDDDDTGGDNNDDDDDSDDNNDDDGDNFADTIAKTDLTKMIATTHTLLLMLNMQTQMVMIKVLMMMTNFNVQFCRHDCQDGSDENDCDYSHLAVNKNFFCFR